MTDYEHPGVETYGSVESLTKDKHDPYGGHGGGGGGGGGGHMS